MGRKKNKKNALLWKIEGKTLPGYSYLFGTMHVKDQRAFTLMNDVYPKIDACESFATEFNLEEMDLNFDLELTGLENGQSLQDLIRPKNYHKIRKIFRKATGLDIIHFDQTQPLIVANVINERILSKDMPVSLDMHLWNYAKVQEKITLGIETFQEQINILKKIPLDYQIKMLLAMGKNFKSHRKSIIKMTRQYEKADIRQLYKSGLKSAGGLKHLLIYDRNILMAERIGRYIEEQTMFCAIGAGHLAGKYGVLRLLKKQGFKVKPV